jgi:glycosyltransferase involved in cell wall biosynthesis
MEFSNLDKKAHGARNANEKIAIYREIVEKAKKDEQFRLSIDKETFKNSNTILSHLLKNEKRPDGSLKIAILGYKIGLMDKWDPFTVSSGLPGSEECAVYGSQELANRGHSVTLYMNPPDDSIWSSPFSNPRWLPEDYWLNSSNTERYDMVFMWRRFDVNTGRLRSNKIFFWPHDSPPIINVNLIFPSFDGICILSQHHYDQFSKDEHFLGFQKIPYTISGNGVLLEQFSNPISFTNPYSIGYFSNYARGLIVLLSLWPLIKKEFPSATLSICYGREHWNTMSDQDFKYVIDKIEEYKPLGVTEHGKIGHIELANIMQQTSVLAYPCIVTSETFCITVVKAQLAGMIPVTTRIAALNETVHPDAPTIPEIKTNIDIENYLQKLIETLRRINNPEILQERLKYIEYAKQYSWQHCVDKWLNLYQKVK